MAVRILSMPFTSMKYVEKAWFASKYIFYSMAGKLPLQDLGHQESTILILPSLNCHKKLILLEHPMPEQSP